MADARTHEPELDIAEAQQKLAKHQPETLGQAARISGITPATISVLMVYAKRGFSGQRKTA